MRNNFFLIALLLFSLTAVAQKDYIVTEKNDTIYGTVRHNFALFGNKITVRTEDGKMQFHYRQIKAYQQLGKKYVKVKEIGKNGRERTWHCRVVVEGKLGLVEEITQEGAAHFLYYEGNYHYIQRKYFPTEIWEKLMQCQSFADAYADHHKEKGSKVIILPRHLKEWVKIVRFYNQHCSRLDE